MRGWYIRITCFGLLLFKSHALLRRRSGFKNNIDTEQSPKYFAQREERERQTDRHKEREIETDRHKERKRDRQTDTKRER